MNQQTVRQQARRDARQVTSAQTTALLGRAKRLEDLAVAVMTALGERDAAEKRAGLALREMTKVEGVMLRDAVEWCGDRVSAREATRLRRLAENEHDAETGDKDVYPDSAGALAARTAPVEGGGVAAGLSAG